MVNLDGISIKIKWAVLVLLVSLITLPRAEAKAPGLNTESIPNWSDIYVFPVSIINYHPIDLKPKNFDPYSCISFAKAVLGYSGTWGNARDIVPNSDEPSIGAVVLTDESRFGHAGVVIDFTKDEITIIEANYIKGKVGQRTLKRNSSKIRGYRIY